VLTSAAIVDMANQLAYAKRHEVPFQFLIGFLAEVQVDLAAKKERAGEWEDWHPLSGQVKTPKSPKDPEPKRAAKRQSAAPAAKESAGQKSKKEKTKSTKPSKV